MPVRATLLVPLCSDAQANGLPHKHGQVTAVMRWNKKSAES